MTTFWERHFYFSWGFVVLSVNLCNFMVGFEWARNDVTICLIFIVITVDTTDWDAEEQASREVVNG